jgi:transposase InsO family protein
MDVVREILERIPFLFDRERLAFALDCCDREAMSFLATTSGVSGEDVRDLMLAAVEHRFGRVCYIAGDIRSFTRDLNHSMREALAMRMGTARSATPPPAAYAKNRRLSTRVYARLLADA